MNDYIDRIHWRLCGCEFDSCESTDATRRATSLAHWLNLLLTRANFSSLSVGINCSLRCASRTAWMATCFRRRIWYSTSFSSICKLLFLFVLSSTMSCTAGHKRGDELASFLNDMSSFWLYHVDSSDTDEIRAMLSLEAKWTVGLRRFLVTLVCSINWIGTL